MISGAESVARAASRSASGRADKSSKTLRNISAEALRLVGELAFSVLGALAGGGAFGSGVALEVSFDLRYAAEIGDEGADGAGVALVVCGRGVGGTFLR